MADRRRDDTGAFDYEGPLPQEKIQSGYVSADVPRVQHVRDGIQPQFFIFPCNQIPVKQEIDKRARHIMLNNDGFPGGTAGPDLLFAWGTGVTPGAGGLIHFGETLTFDDLFLTNTVLYFQTPPAPAPANSAIVRLWYW